MRFRLTFIFIAFGAANGPTFVQSFKVFDSFTQSCLSKNGTESLQKWMLQKGVDGLREENLLERTASRSFPNTGLTPNKLVQHGDLKKSSYSRALVCCFKFMVESSLISLRRDWMNQVW